MKSDNKGFTLIESLFGFFIYINIIVMFITLMCRLFDVEDRIIKGLNDINDKEEIQLIEKEFKEIIEMVLH